MSEKTPTTSISFPDEELLARGKKEAERQGISFAKLVNICLRDYLDAQDGTVREAGAKYRVGLNEEILRTVRNIEKKVSGK